MSEKSAPETGTGRQVALVTGASSGIGAAVAARLAAAGGWDLLLSGRDEQRLAKVAAETAGMVLRGDLASREGCDTLSDSALARTGRVDLLVAAAGVGWSGPFTRMPVGALEEVLAVDLAAVVHLVRAILPGMVLRGSGHLAIVGSIAGRVGVREEAVYSAAKGGLAAFAESLRYELTGTDVRVSMVLPGVVRTPFFARRGVPYRRSWPRPIPSEQVADAVYEAVRRGRDEVFVPAWLGLPARLQGLAPGVFRKLAGRFG
ncbi:SDR family NAD(P)-dependent oxidoreductase [Streptomyces meridianus]|uniref:SDR family NAD(P)-dependent oxidoreductase n=1 Tax=Streptomyces meridianus TaxID=2938945 RepID=A0ABT0XDW6_9ACTN|nr:SDR family NAD(P)-dependent oxidoreductase [Streptomyces meridianus]MCM2579947.1 SDR family NAD(P)-dependent oxidoreductase [Streptomyces meridianus]